MSHPTMGAWIEILLELLREYAKYPSHPTMGAWIEIICRNVKAYTIQVAPHDGCVD